MYWLPLLLLLLHMLEEYPRFPAWATRHFGATSKAWYVYSHIVLVTLVLYICWWADRSAPQSWGRILGTALMITLAFNGGFHIVTTLLFREYSPGVVTGTLLFLPAAGYLLFITFHDSVLTTAQIGSAIAIGTAVQAAVIASLYLHLDINWRFQRPSTAQ